MKSLILSAVIFLMVITACRGTFQIGMEHASTNSHIRGVPSHRLLPVPLPRLL